MQPLAAALAGATSSRVVVRCSAGTSTSEATRSIGSVRRAAPVSSCSQTGFVRWNSQGIVRRTNGGAHERRTTFSTRRHSLKAAAAAVEDGPVDLLTLEAPSEADVEQEPLVGEENVEPEEDNGPKTIVRFFLEKECHFGQQFNVVGEIPELGEWDPSQSVPMVWSEGHVWTAEVPIPVGLTVKYKFVMTGKRLELEWQPGEDKVFETIAAEDITVTGVWDDSLSLEDVPTDGSPGESENALVDDLEEEEEEGGGGGGASTNGLATASADSDLQAAAVVAEAVADYINGTEESLDGAESLIDAENEQEEEPEESLEIPFVNAALVTAVAEVSGEVEDAAASKDI